MSKQKFYICRHCGNIITYAHRSGVQVVCCGDTMLEVEPNTTDAATEKHVPEIKIEGNKVTVTVGSVLHPMAEEHHIEWIVLETNEGTQRKELTVGGNPEAVFTLNEGEKVVSAFEYCNLHGLWKKEV